VLKVGDSDWSEVRLRHIDPDPCALLTIMSKVLDVEAPTAETDLMIPRRNVELHLGVSWTPGSGNYKLTKIITLAPRFIIKNNSGTPICYRELGGPLPEQPEIAPDAKAPIHWTRRGPDKMLKFKYPGLNGEWYVFLHSATNVDANPSQVCSN
jgi:vacuolar protein sorting-associated protein 13A/C